MLERKTDSEVIKTRYSSKDSSIYNPDYTLGEIIEGKLNHLLNKVESAPHIVPITKQQICMSEKPFYDLDKDNPLRVPLVGFYDTEAKHIGGRRPSVREQRQYIAKHGLGIKWPDDSLMNIIQSKYSKLVKEYREKDSSILPAPFRRYFNEDGTVKNPEWNQYKPLHHSYYAGYLMIHKSYINEIQDYLMNPNTPNWIKYQFIEARAYSIYAYQRRIERQERNIINTEADLLEIKQTIGNINTSLKESELSEVFDIYN